MGKHIRWNRQPRTRPTGDWSQLTLPHAIRGACAEYPRLAANTLRGNRQVATNLERLSPTIRRTPLAALTSEALIEYQHLRLSQGTKPSTVLHDVDVISAVLRQLGFASILDGARLVRPKEPEIGHAITKEEKARLLEACGASSYDHHALFDFVLLGTLGMRYGEILALTVADYDHATSTLLIRKSKTPSGIRRIPIPPAIAEALALRADRRRQESGPTAPLWKGKTQAARETFEPAWAAARLRAGLPTCRFHDLRHTAITELCEAAVPDWTIRAYIGHVSERAMKLYSHPRLTAMLAASNALATCQLTNTTTEPARQGQKEDTP